MVFKFSTSGVFPHELPSTPTTGIIFLALGLLYVAYVRYATALRSIPGPFLASITRIWIFQKQSTFQRPLIDIDLHKKYGPIVRVSPEEVMVSSPKSFRRIYAAGSKFTKGEWYQGTGARGYNGPDNLDFFSEKDMEKYRVQRRALGPAYAEAFMKYLEPKMDEILSKNIRLMRERSGQVVDLDIFFNYFASDMYSTATFSKAKGLVESNQDDGSVAAIHRMWKLMHVIGYFPLAHRFLVWITHAKPPKSLKNVMKRLFPFYYWYTTKAKPHRSAFPTSQIQERFTARDNGNLSSDQPTDIASKLLQLQAEKGKLPDKWIRSMCMANFSAGVETTAIVLSTLIQNVVSRAQVQARIHAEIDRARKEGRLSYPPKTREMKEQLPYLSACLSESMRLHPVVGMPLVRTVPEGGCELEGKWIPAGVTVGVNPWVLSRSRELYGDDAEIWRPERWLEYSQEELKHLETYNLSFGAGARSCPGKYLAQTVYTKMIPMLFMDMDWSFTDPGQEKVLQCTFSVRFMRMMMQWRERESGEVGL